MARDLIARGVTKPARLGIMGGSNGGLLMGVEFTQHPELWSAVDMQVPLLDMLGSEHIAAGSAWVGEYGSIVFISSMIPYATEITPQLIIIKLEEFDYVGAAGLGLAMLIMSFAIVATVNLLQHLASKRRGTS